MKIWNQANILNYFYLWLIINQMMDKDYNNFDNFESKK